MNPPQQKSQPAKLPERGVVGSGAGLGRYNVICDTPGCGWAGDFDDMTTSRETAAGMVECEPDHPAAEHCCPKCLLANQIETDGWGDHQLPKRAFRPNGQKLRRPEPNVRNNQNAHSQIRSANEGLPPALC